MDNIDSIELELPEDVDAYFEELESNKTDDSELIAEMEKNAYKPTDMFTEEELDERYMAQYGMTYREFEEKYPPVTSEDLRKMNL